MGSIASLIVNLGLNSASFTTGIKTSRQALSGIAKTIASTQRMIAGAFVGSKMISEMRNVVREADAALKTPAGTADFAKRFAINPEKLRPMVDSFQSMQQAMKNVAATALSELAPALKGTADLVQSVIRTVKGFAESTVGSLANLVRLIASVWLFAKALNFLIPVIRALINIKKIWASVTAVATALAGGWVQLVVAAAVAAGAVVALNLAFDAAEASGNNATDALSDMTTSARQTRVVIDEATVSVRRLDQFISELDKTSKPLQQTFRENRYLLEGYSKAAAAFLAAGGGRGDALELDILSGWVDEQAKLLQGKQYIIETTTALQDQVKTWGMTADAVEVYRFGLAKATQDQFALLRSLQATRAELKAMDMNIKRLDQWKLQGEQLAKTLRTPFEMFEDAIRNIDFLSENGAISLDTYSRAAARLFGTFLDSMEAIGRGGRYVLENPNLSIESQRAGGGQSIPQSISGLIQELRQGRGITEAELKRIRVALENAAA